jgi:4-amino-4-deoxy-L-arabinose transferase-like glycosyltransferase
VAHGRLLVAVPQLRRRHKGQIDRHALTSRYGIFVLVALYVFLGSTYSVLTPVMEASDELWHYPMVKYIADHWALPVQDPENVGPWRQEGSQPPLYYILAALLTSWIDTSDLDQVRWLNPHADNGIITGDGNTNLIVHRPAEGASWGWADTALYGGETAARPWRGTVLAVHLIRFASVAMGAGTVYLGYLLALEVWPARKRLALAAAAITAFNPMFCFITGAVNNDNLAMLLCALGIWLLVRLVGRHGGERSPGRAAWWRDVGILGGVLGLGTLTKSSAMGLLPLTAAAIGYVAWKRRSWWHFASGGMVTAGLVLAISGWWFVRNAVLYDGDWMGIERFITILGYRVPPATVRQLWGERQSFMMAYWGLFGGVNVPMPQWIYVVLNGALLASVAGLAAAVVRWVAQAQGGRTAGRASWVRSLDLAPSTFQIVLLCLWPLAVVIPWAAWAVKTWSSQGRLVFSAISAWSLWMAVGLSQLFLWPRLLRPWAGLLPGIASLFMFGVAAWAPAGVIAPAYRPPILPADGLAVPTHVLQADVGGKVRLLGYDIERASMQPGETVSFALYWEALERMDRNWSVFCHVLDPEIESTIAIRDRYPGQGLLATSLMEPGLRWVDRYRVPLPETVFAPSDTVLEVGLYDLATQERLPIRIETGEGVVVDNALRFQPLQILPRPGDTSNPVDIRFGDRLVLTGWNVDRRVVPAGENLGLTLYWECLAPMAESYTVSTQVLTEDRRKAAQMDAWPADRDTSSCRKGEQIVDHRTLEIDANAPPDTYELLISVYWVDSSRQLQRLRIIHADGRVLPEDSWTLGKVRVVP